LSEVLDGFLIARLDVGQGRRKLDGLGWVCMIPTFWVAPQAEED
jgi:hypothetical protein